MCGFLFVQQSDASFVSHERFDKAVLRQAWRGPDATKTMAHANGHVLFGHNRLAILDPVARSDQPMLSACSRYVIVFNGEIYNHKSIRERLQLSCATGSDTETLLEGFARVGKDIFPMLDGMFAFVIFDKEQGTWVAVRDRFGIKPLSIYSESGKTIIGSEPAVIASLAGAGADPESVDEWRILRRPVPGRSFFRGIAEVPPGSYLDSDGRMARYWNFSPSSEAFSQEKFESLMSASVKGHELSDVANVSLLSGGLDSAVITALSSVKYCYTVGLSGNHEFEGAADTARTLGRELIAESMSQDELRETWADLTRLRGEPLSVPNEGLIYRVCKKMKANEKVLLTGEGADELLFGYDNIFRWAVNSTWSGVDDFLSRYGYSATTAPTPRLRHYVESLMVGKPLIEAVEDFFYQVHLPCLLRRMDFASMAASKEARVPFVDRTLVEYLYRQKPVHKINQKESKIPLRTMAARLRLEGALNRKKIGFSAQSTPGQDRKKEYEEFQTYVMGVLGW